MRPSQCFPVITEFVPATMDDEEPPVDSFDAYCDDCERAMMQARNWHEGRARTHAGKHIRHLLMWYGERLPVERAVVRMIGGNPAMGYR